MIFLSGAPFKGCFIKKFIIRIPRITKLAHCIIFIGYLLFYSSVITMFYLNFEYIFVVSLCLNNKTISTAVRLSFNITYECTVY